MGLLCLENFAPAAAMLDVDYVAVLPGSAILAGLDNDWRLALGALDATLDGIRREFPADVVLNATATLSARLLARRLAGEGPILGFGLDAEGFSTSGDTWATFLQGASVERINCPYNVVDMFRAAAGVGHLPPAHGLRQPAPSVREAARAFLSTAMPSGPAGFVGFQLGASEARRQWPVEYFAAVGAALWKESGLCPVLLGSPAERPLAEAYAGHASGAPFVDAVGRTDIPLLAGLLLETRLLVSNDTGTMHLAAGLGVPVLGIFLATAQPWDTGPYLPGSCCLEPAMDCHPCSFRQQCPRDLSCLRHISPATVLHLVQRYLGEGRWPALATPFSREARIWGTRVDATGCMDLESLSGHENQERTQWLRMQRYFYRHTIDSLNGVVPPQGLEAPRGCALSPEFRQRTGETLRHAEELLQLLLEQAAVLRRMPGSSVGQRFLGTCQRIHTLLSQHPPLAALGHLWQVLAQERGGKLDDVTRMAATLRAAVAAWRCSVLQDMDDSK